MERDAHALLNYGVDGHLVGVDTVISDARAARKANKISLQTHGFTLETHKTGLQDRQFFEPDIVEKVYYAEMKNRIARITNCDDVVILGHLARDNKAADNRGKENPFAGGGNGVNGYVSVVHTDFRMEKAYELASRLSRGDADTRDKNARFMFINAWRNVSSVHPIYNNTLCCCDGKTVDTVMPCDVRLPDGKTAQQYRLSPGEAEQHRWFYFPNMTKDEVLYFVQYDSDPLSPCRYCFHTAFSDPMVDPGLPQRQSVEVRAIAFFHDYMDAPPPLAKNLSAELFATRTGARNAPVDPMEMEDVYDVAQAGAGRAFADGAFADGNKQVDVEMEKAMALSRQLAEEEEKALGNKQANDELEKAMALSRQLAEEEEKELEAALQVSIAMSGGAPPEPAAPAMPAAVAAGQAAAARAAAAGYAPPKPAALSAELQVTVHTMAERGGQSAEAIAAMLGLDLKAVQDTLNPPAVDISEGGVAPLPPVLAESAGVMSGRGMAAAQIAQMLNVEVARVEVTLKTRGESSGAGGAGGAGPSLKRQRSQLKRQSSQKLDQAMAADERAYNEAIRASLAAELGHVSRQVSFDMDI